MNKTNRKTLTRAAVTAILAAAASGVGAHTTVYAPVPAYAGSASMNYIQVGHGCLNEATGARLPVVAQSVVLPNTNVTVVKKNLSGTILDSRTGTFKDLAPEFTATDHTGAVADLESVGDVIRPILPQAGWDKTVTRFDPTITSRVLGWYSRGGFKLGGTSNYTEQPFKVSTVNMKTDSCARSLQVKIAIADVCKLNKHFPPTKEGASADLWIPNTTTKFPNGDVDAVGTPVDANDPSKGSVPLTGYPATLTLWRDQLGTNPAYTPNKDAAGNLKSSPNPIPVSCNSAYNANMPGVPDNTPYDVVVYPADADVDANLPFPGFGAR